MTLASEAMRRAPAMIGAAFLLAAVSPAHALSKAAEYLLAEQAKDACTNGKKGRFQGAVERDLTGDGKADLVIHHADLNCAEGQSHACGYTSPAGCSVIIYVREGALLVEKFNGLSISVNIGKGDRPKINLSAPGPRIGDEPERFSIRWNGAAFK